MSRKPCLGLSTRGDSHGICCPFNALSSQSPRPSVLREGCLTTSPKTAASCPPAGPTPPATVPLSGFLNLSATFLLLLPPYHFQIGGVHGVAPFRGLVLSRSPSSSSLPVCPHDVVPTGCAASVPGRSAARHVCQYLGKTALHVFRRLQGFSPRENRPGCQSMVSVLTTGLPLLGFHLLMV